MWLSVRNSLSNGFTWLLAFQISRVIQVEARSRPACLLLRSETPQSSVHGLGHQLISAAAACAVMAGHCELVYRRGKRPADEYRQYRASLIGGIYGH
jgi:hypothetical protein